MFHSDPNVSAEGLDPDFVHATLRQTLKIDFLGVVAGFEGSRRKDFVPVYENAQPLFVAILGGIIDFLLFAVLLSLAGRRNEAMALANDMR